MHRWEMAAQMLGLALLRGSHTARFCRFLGLAGRIQGRQLRPLAWLPALRPEGAELLTYHVLITLY